MPWLSETRISVGEETEAPVLLQGKPMDKTNGKNELPSLLLADDDETLCSVLARALEKRGFRVTVAHDYQSALALYLTKPADADDVVAALHHESGTSSAPICEKPLSVNRLEWEHINRVLAGNNGNISATARVLGMHRRTLQRKLSKHPVRE